MSEATAVKPDFRLYFDETTEYWKEDIQRRAGKLYDVYVFDANKHVCCCELTPSFEMWYIGPTWDGRGPEAPDDDEGREHLFDEILEGTAETPSVMYVHVSDVNVDDCEETFKFHGKQWDEYLKDHDGNRDMAWEDALEDVMEYCRCNGYIY